MSRQLNASGNWTIDTVAKLLFAINGNLVAASEMDPERQETANHIRPDWLHDGQQQGATISVTAAPLTSYTVTRHGHISVGMETSVPTGGRIWYAREEPSARTANH
ncbi:MAG: hypothetical protein HZT43_08240 [Exiguobacterium profundum]|nr:MAG: hypothetical protein HZT43_08240 [Exiguobacterium profundum]